MERSRICIILVGRHVSELAEEREEEVADAIVANARGREGMVVVREKGDGQCYGGQVLTAKVTPVGKKSRT